jgi:hypothetical protein
MTAGDRPLGARLASEAWRATIARARAAATYERSRALVAKSRRLRQDVRRASAARAQPQRVRRR